MLTSRWAWASDSRQVRCGLYRDANVPGRRRSITFSNTWTVSAHNEQCKSITSGQSKKKATLPPHMDGSIIFSRWCQCAPHLIHASLAHPSAHPKQYLDQFSRFCTAHCREAPILHNGPIVSPQNCPFPWRHPDSNLLGGSFGTHESTTKTASGVAQPFLHGSQLWQTDRPRYSIYNNRPHLHCESKKGATLSMAITLSVLDWFAKFFHCCKEH